MPSNDPYLAYKSDYNSIVLKAFCNIQYKVNCPCFIPELDYVEVRCGGVPPGGMDWNNIVSTDPDNFGLVNWNFNTKPDAISGTLPETHSTYLDSTDKNFMRVYTSGVANYFPLKNNNFSNIVGPYNVNCVNGVTPGTSFASWPNRFYVGANAIETAGFPYPDPFDPHTFYPYFLSGVRRVYYNDNLGNPHNLYVNPQVIQADYEVFTEPSPPINTIGNLTAIVEIEVFCHKDTPLSGGPIDTNYRLSLTTVIPFVTIYCNFIDDPDTPQEEEVIYLRFFFDGIVPYQDGGETFLAPDGNYNIDVVQHDPNFYSFESDYPPSSYSPIPFNNTYP